MPGGEERQHLPHLLQLCCGRARPAWPGVGARRVGARALVQCGGRCRASHEAAAAQGAKLRQWGAAALEAPAEGAAVVAASLDADTLALLWSDGTLQCLRVALGAGQQASLRIQVRVACACAAQAPHIAGGGGGCHRFRVSCCPTCSCGGDRAADARHDCGPEASASRSLACRPPGAFAALVSAGQHWGATRR